MQRILKRKGLVRKLLAAETLGSTSVIATDKTCTLTEGKMALAEAFLITDSKKDSDTFFKIIALSNEAFVENPEDPLGEWNVRGRPTDKALLIAAAEEGFFKHDLEKQEEQVAEILFDSSKKYAAGLYSIKGGFNLYSLGAPEKIISFSRIKFEDLNRVNEKLGEMTNEGYRVIAVSHKHIESPENEIQDLEKEMKGLTFLGFIALRDPLRKDAKNAIRDCVKAGMRPIIVTGDHKLTAKAVARELGMSSDKKNIIEGAELKKLSEEEFMKRLKNITVYARVDPEDKLRIINAWQEMGEVVAMTGDGINDAPALKKADIGLALGSGTSVARETSDLILLNDNFNIILAAVEEGRAILDNIRKVITYLLSDSFSEIILIGGALAMGFPLPILPGQILWVNLIEDGLPSVALAFEPKEKG